MNCHKMNIDNKLLPLVDNFTFLQGRVQSGNWENSQTSTSVGTDVQHTD